MMMSLARMGMEVRRKKADGAAACRVRDWVGSASIQR